MNSKICIFLFCILLIHCVQATYRSCRTDASTARDTCNSAAKNRKEEKACTEVYKAAMEQCHQKYIQKFLLGSTKRQHWVWDEQLKDFDGNSGTVELDLSLDNMCGNNGIFHLHFYRGYTSNRPTVQITRIVSTGSDFQYAGRVKQLKKYRAGGNWWTVFRVGKKANENQYPNSTGMYTYFSNAHPARTDGYGRKGVNPYYVEGYRYLVMSFINGKLHVYRKGPWQPYMTYEPASKYVQATEVITYKRFDVETYPRTIVSKYGCIKQHKCSSSSLFGGSCSGCACTCPEEDYKNNAKVFEDLDIYTNGPTGYWTPATCTM